MPTIGHQMEKSIVYPVVNPNTSNSFQQQPMKRFIKELVTLLLVDTYLFLNHARFAGLFFVFHPLIIFWYFKLLYI